MTHRWISAALIIVIAVMLSGCAWEYATEVPMTVEVQIYDSAGSYPASIPCTGRIRYDRAGRIHIIGGIGPEMTSGRGER